MAGATAGLIQCIATNPMEIVKIRLQTAALNGEVVTMGETVKEMGLKGLYRVRCLLSVYPVLCRAVVCGASIAAGPSWASRAVQR